MAAFGATQGGHVPAHETGGVVPPGGNPGVSEGKGGELKQGLRPGVNPASKNKGVK